LSFYKIKISNKPATLVQTNYIILNIIVIEIKLYFPLGYMSPEKFEYMMKINKGKKNESNQLVLT